MANTLNFEQVQELVTQLPPQEQLKLAARICDQLSAMPSTDFVESETEHLWRERLRLAEGLLAEVEDIENDAQGEFDAAADIRRMREERTR
jgi:hypothetical protein